MYGRGELKEADLTLRQKLQMVSGTLKTKGKTKQITDGKMRGDQISFKVGDVQYTGNVNGNTIEGTCTSGGNNRHWTATRAAVKSSKTKM